MSHSRPCPGRECRPRELDASSGPNGPFRVHGRNLPRSHGGDAPDPLAVDAASSRGYDIGNIRVRKVEARDFEGTTLLATDTLVPAFLRNMALHGLGDRPRLLPRYTALGRDNIVDAFGGAPVDDHVALNFIEASCEALMSALLLNRRL
ncbi:hypothetical protein [Reyranella sp.]|uniref:hypothetical protein n=1 Tax=Reyranella sp. TaxID=1929291 RepID=UPI000BC3B4BE|nr:hypothetical protein [Reyranella sp.]OYY36217.1 MAG: hypothetical protein B7Y57_24820 [Rhodospirillales bacterium 35-66-84]OYZ91128.1 MAG: hypothetical protein B7Y08_27115 [Rhodospirillales bacterium 24-66-33]OZB22624.1 MAG: hypothetical protein B7X63_22160 [Rhodospirillales bacterium 39-66-50]HQS18702.1 hypothetical protein [Reyranella sp.]HQT15174.1 hypothetical protein [Reyranella sp.]